MGRHQRTCACCALSEPQFVYLQESNTQGHVLDNLSQHLLEKMSRCHSTYSPFLILRRNFRPSKCLWAAIMGWGEKPCRQRRVDYAPRSKALQGSQQWPASWMQPAEKRNRGNGRMIRENSPIFPHYHSPSWNRKIITRKLRGMGGKTGRAEGY